MSIKDIDRWHKTKKGLLAFGLVELALGYGFASWAIDSANLLDYLFAFVFTIGGIQNLVKLVRGPSNAKRSGSVKKEVRSKNV